MKKIISNRYEITTCTAIAVTEGSTTREDAIFFHDMQDSNGDGDGIIFGYNFDWINDESDISGMGDSFSTAADDIATVEF